MKYLGIPSFYELPYLILIPFNYLAINYGIKHPLEKRKDIEYRFYRDKIEFKERTKKEESLDGKTNTAFVTWSLRKDLHLLVTCRDALNIRTSRSSIIFYSSYLLTYF